MTELQIDTMIAYETIKDTRTLIFKGYVLTEEQYDQYHAALAMVN